MTWGFAGLPHLSCLSLLASQKVDGRGSFLFDDVMGKLGTADEGTRERGENAAGVDATARPFV